MYKDGYSDSEKLEMIKKAQSFNGVGEDANKYVGQDNFRCITIPKGQRLYSFQPDIQYEKMRKEKKIVPFTFEFFFDQATYDRFVNKGTFDSTEVAEYLQVGYYMDPLFTDGHGEYRDSIYAFDLLEDIRVPVGVCLANNQFGDGEGHQCYIPKDMAIKLQEENLLVFNEEASLIDKGINKYITAERCQQIDDAVDNKLNYCEKNNLKHCPPSISPVDAPIHEPITPIVFDTNYLKMANAYDGSLMDKKSDPSLSTFQEAEDHSAKPSIKTLSCKTVQDMDKTVGPVKGTKQLKAPVYKDNSDVIKTPEVKSNTNPNSDSNHSLKQENIDISEKKPVKHELTHDSSIKVAESDKADVKNPLAGLNNLRSYMDSEKEESLDTMELPNEPYYV